MKAAIEKTRKQLIVVDPRRIELVNYATLWLPENREPMRQFFRHGSRYSSGKLYNQEFRYTDRKFCQLCRVNGKVYPRSLQKLSPARSLIDYPGSKDGMATAKNAAIYWALGIPEWSTERTMHSARSTLPCLPVKLAGWGQV